MRWSYARPAPPETAGMMWTTLSAVTRDSSVARLAVDEGVDVEAQARAGLAEAVPHARVARVELEDEAGKVVRGDLEAARDAREEGDQRARQLHVGHARAQLSSWTVSTEEMPGRKSARRRQLRPSSRLPKSCPVLVPTYTPAGSWRSVAMASRRTPR